MSFQELIKKLFAGERDGEVLWKIPLGEIRCDPIVDPAEGVMVASLAENILRFGMLQPILLRRLEDTGALSEKYQLIAGRRRLEAIRMLGRTHIQAIVVKCNAKQASAMRLAENLMREKPHYLELAKALLALEEDGWSREKLTTIYAMEKGHIDKLEAILLLPPEQIRTIRHLGIEYEDIMRLMDCSDEQRRAILHKCVTTPSINPSVLIRQVQETANVALTQTQKGMIRDIRVFQNSVEKAVTTMKTAGFDASVRRIDCEDYYEFSIQVAKMPTASSDKSSGQKVSRETLSHNHSAAKIRPPQFSAVSGIFAALAKEECTIANHVSRETSDCPMENSAKNAEKIEICIDD